uniref:Mitochondrial mRNA pseudouridine synthase RPUSD3 n=1 Tax=Catharus ustulatus TaxID=91951 RepID=A0A8C3V4I3_CATUS
VGPSREVPPVSPYSLHPLQVEAAAGPQGDAETVGELCGAPRRYLRQGRMGARETRERGYMLTRLPSLGALLALNKPPGLPVLGRPGDLSLDVLLPTLRRRLGLTAELHVVKAPAREYSGLVLLSSCYHTTKKLQQFFTNALLGTLPSMVRGLARKDVKSTLTRYRVLSAVGGCALLQLQPRTGEWLPSTSTTPAMLPDSCNLTFSLFLPSLSRTAPGAPGIAAVPGPG